MRFSNSMYQFASMSVGFRVSMRCGSSISPRLDEVRVIYLAVFPKLTSLVRKVGECEELLSLDGERVIALQLASYFRVVTVRCRSYVNCLRQRNDREPVRYNLFGAIR